MTVPADIMRNTPEFEMGLALILNSTNIGRNTKGAPAQTSAAASPPLLGTRLSPRCPPPQSPSSEYAPMHTPSPSLRAQPNAYSFPSPNPAPAVHSQPPTPGEPHGCIPASTAVSEGLNLLALPNVGNDEEEGLGMGLPGYDSDDLITVVPEDNDNTPTEEAGLGLGLAGWDDDDLITVVPSEGSSTRSPSPVQADAHIGLGIDLDFLAESNDAFETLIVDELDGQDDEYESPLPAYYNLLIDAAERVLLQSPVDADSVSASSTSSPATLGTVTHGRVQHESVDECVGLGIEEAYGTLLSMDIVDSIEEAGRHMPESVKAAFDENYSEGGNYAAKVLRQEEFMRKELRMKLSLSLPVIEEDITEAYQ